jgi:ribosome-associated translation inhibitor RaiA
VPFNYIFLNKSDPSFEQAIDDTVNTLQAMLRKEKEKQRDRRQNAQENI